MRAGDLVWRFAGSVILVGASATGCFATPLSSTTTLSGLAIALASFFLACFGALLLTRGRKLRDKWRTALSTTASAQSNANPLPENVRALLAWDAAMGGRASVATYLILRAQERTSLPHRGRKPPRPVKAARHPELLEENI